MSEPKAATRMRAAWQGYLPLIAIPVAIWLLVPREWPRWALMWSLAFAIYCGCKWLTWWLAPASGAPWWKHAGYLLLWPGLDARAFLSGTSSPAQPREWLLAAGKLACGLGLLFGILRWLDWLPPWIVGWAGMLAIVVSLHFGLFHLLSCFWRMLGADARPLMNWPLAARSISEFWGQRWNTAFRDLTHRFLFRPLTTRLGPRWAIAAGFVASGLVHDLVISLPAGGGYGGPTLFFVIQGMALLAERSRFGKAAGLGRGLRGWLLTMLVLATPAGLLFHPPFVTRIVLPFLSAIGAIA